MKLWLSVTAALLMVGHSMVLAANADGVTVLLDVLPEPGECFQSAQFSCWIPESEKPVTAVLIHQHGCTQASPEKHPPITGDFHWRALARKHHAALLVPMYRVSGGCDEWNHPDSGSERALFTALRELSQRLGHQELASVPWVMWGHSGGSSWSAQMIVRHPQRVLAASFRGGCHKQFGDPAFRALFASAARELPLLFVWGKREAVPTSSHYVSWVPMNTMLRELREKGGLVARVVDPRSEHDCCDSRLLVTSFFDAVLTHAEKRSKLPGALVSLASSESVELKAANLVNPEFLWLPTPRLADLWREFSESGTLKAVKPRLNAPVLKMAHNPQGKAVLSWSVEPALEGGLRALCFQRDGKPWKKLALQPSAFLATARDSTPTELRAHEIVEEDEGLHTYTMSYVDGAGNESPKSLAIPAP